MGVGVLGYLLCVFNIFCKGQNRSIVHDRGKSAVNSLLDKRCVGGVVEVQADRDRGAAGHFTGAIKPVFHFVPLDVDT